ncbi:MAG: GspE/PulE family protein [Candidatus Paceibacterota bacterium]|jgi:type IV pilus assembly protein PilB
MPIQFDEEKQKQKLDTMRHKEEEDLAQTLSTKYGVPYINLSSVAVSTDALRLVDEKTARDLKVAPFSLTGKKVAIGALSPNKDGVSQIIQKLKNDDYEPELYIVSNDGLERTWERYKDLSFAKRTEAGSLEISSEEVANLAKELITIKDTAALIKKTIDEKQRLRVSHIMEIILAGALAAESSDIHIEPEESDVRMRYRLDGVLNDVLNFDHKTYKLLLSRIKLLSGLKLNVKAEAQDGRFSVKIGVEIEIRTSIIPGNYGESIVMRILNPKTIAVPFEELGMNQKLRDTISTELNKPNGLILTTGPTGSGKTTTLYAFLKKIHTPTVKIITIEDPIEYHLQGIVQTQTDNQEYTFANGLRSALRQDPDVIMVGEIRDNETADIAINASLTGHLVFSTLHTNDAAGAYPRLIDIGINPKIIGSAVTLTMAQRLVRRLCPVCKKKAPPKDTDKKMIEKILKTLPPGESAPKDWQTFEPTSCAKCNHTGYKGRIGIFEGIKTNEAIEKLISENPSDREIRKIAKPQGLLTMQQDGIIKVLEGMTSLDELVRVVDLEQDTEKEIVN